MTDTRKSNKKAGSEDEVGEIHNLTTKLHLLRLRKMFNLISDGADAEDVIGDGKALLAAGKWSADHNGITCAQPEDDKESELAKRLEQIKKAQSGQGARANGTTNVQFLFDDEGV